MFRRATTALLASAAMLSPACGSGDDGGGGGTTSTATTGGAISVWAAPAGVKIQPTTAPGSLATLTFEGARGAVEGAQFAVHAAGGPLAGVDATASALEDGAGHTLPASAFTFYREHYIDFSGVVESEPGSLPVPASSPTGDPRIADPLVPFVDPYGGGPAGAPFAVARDENAAVWVDVAIPAGTAPGSYQGQIVVHAEGESDAVLAVSVTVWDFDLPDMSSVSTWFRGHFGSAIRYHRDSYACNGADCWLDWTPAARELVKRYEALAHEHRIDAGPFFVPDPDAPDTCSPPTDWSAYDAALGPYIDGSYFGDGVPHSWFPTPFEPGVDWGLGTCTQAEYTAVAAAWAAHLTAKGWMSRAIAYAYDEPPPAVLPTIAQHAAWMQAADPAWKARILVTTAPTPASAPILDPAVGIYSVCLRCFDDWAQSDDYYGRAEWPGLWAQGTQLWFYESNAQSDPYPTFATNTLLGDEPRIALWGSFYEGATGFLLWDTVAWDDANPWGPNASWGKTGDGVLLYPGNHDGLAAPAGSPGDVAIDGPVPSYRLKMVRAGLQDWAMFTLASQLGLDAEVRAAIETVYGQLGGCTWQGCAPPVNGQFFWRADPDLVAAARRTVATAIAGALP